MGRLECQICFPFLGVEDCLLNRHSRSWLAQPPVPSTWLTVARLLPEAMHNRIGYQGNSLHLTVTFQDLACLVPHYMTENVKNIEQYLWKEMSWPSLITKGVVFDMKTKCTFLDNRNCHLLCVVSISRNLILNNI